VGCRIRKAMKTSMNNYRMHNTLDISGKICRRELEIIAHSPYSPDLGRCNPFFGRAKIVLQNRIFAARGIGCKKRCVRPGISSSTPVR
jgi:hypothetical protein